MIKPTRGINPHNPPEGRWRVVRLCCSVTWLLEVLPRHPLCAF
jgi:hypothetical protein